MTPYESAWDGRQNTGEAVEFNEGDDYLDRVRPALYEAQDSDEYHYEVAISSARTRSLSTGGSDHES